MNNLLAFCLIVFVGLQEVKAGTILNDTFKITKDEILVTKYVYVKPDQDTATFEFELGDIEDYPIGRLVKFKIIIQNVTIDVTASHMVDALQYIFKSLTDKVALFNPQNISFNSTLNRFWVYDTGGFSSFDGSSDSTWTSIGLAQGVPEGSNYFSIKLDGSPPPYFALIGEGLKGYVPDPEPTKEPTTPSNFSATFNAINLIVLFGVIVLQKVINEMM